MPYIRFHHRLVNTSYIYAELLPLVQPFWNEKKLHLETKTHCFGPTLKSKIKIIFFLPNLCKLLNMTHTCFKGRKRQHPRTSMEKGSTGSLMCTEGGGGGILLNKDVNSSFSLNIYIRGFNFFIFKHKNRKNSFDLFLLLHIIYSLNFLF